MSTQLENKARTLSQMLAANRLTKIAGDQAVENKEPEDQTSLGQEQTEEINQELNGMNQTSYSDAVEAYKSGAQALRASGTGIRNVTNGAVRKTASAHHYALATALRKTANRQARNQTITATEVMNKVASVRGNGTPAQLADIHNSLCKLAAYNPLFPLCHQQVRMRKMAAEAVELAEEAGVSPEEAAAALDDAVAQNPELGQQLNEEAANEAVQELADVEQGAADLQDGIQVMADNATNALGVEVTPDDIIEAADQVVAQAGELGVEPEALVAAAAEDLEAASQVTDEDLEEADAILEEAAAQGISPEEVIEAAAAASAGDEE